MDTSDVIALGALLVAAAGLGLSVWALVYSRRSAAAARDSADEAAQLTRIEEERRRAERQRWHHEREPDLPPEVELKYRDSPGHGPGEGALWATVTFPHVYQVRAFAIAGQSWTPLSLDSVTKPGRAVELMVERWPSGKETLQTEEILFRFWPPPEREDGLAVWRCDCGRSVRVSEEGEGHWERRVKVAYRHPFVL